MITFKKAFAGVALAAATVSFAAAVDEDHAKLNEGNVRLRVTGINDLPGPGSYTSSSTAGRFGNEVDDYMGVNDWSGVEFDKAFGFLAYNGDTSDPVNLGYATHLFGQYVGFWFGGHGADFKMRTTTYSDDKYGKNSYYYEATTDDEVKDDYAAAVLVGIGDIGIKASMYYDPNTSYYTKIDTDKDNYEQQDLWRFYGDVSVGLGGESAIYFDVGADINSAKRQRNTGYYDDSFTDLYLRGGLTLSSGWALDLDTRWRLFPAVVEESSEGKKEVTGYTDNLIKLSAGKGWKWDVSDRFTFKTKLAVPLYIGFYSNEKDGSKDATSGSGDWTYSQSHTHYIDIVTQPTLKFGGVYALRPEKVNFNFGTSVKVGALGWNIDATGYRKQDDEGNYTDKAYDATSTTVQFGWDSASWGITWSSGFTVFVTDKVTLDMEWNILGNVLDGFESNDSNLKDAGGIDKLVNKVLFGNTIKLLLAIKL